MNPNNFSNESNLFQFHLDAVQSFPPTQGEQEAVHISIPQPSHDYYSYFSDNTPTALGTQENGMFSSPQLKPKPLPPHMQRKRCKTVTTPVNTKSEAFSPLALKNCLDSASQKDDENEEDEDEDDSGSDADSNLESDSNKKRGKYKVYTEAEKSTILNFMMKHGMQKTLEIFSNNTHKITKRKLKSWVDSQYKVKGVKGRKTNDPNRDQTLYEWCLAFQKDNGRAPTRKEATQKALELSEDSSFQASKGWLDKFSRKYNIEFTPLKIIPPKNKKKNDGYDGDSVSNSDTSSVDGMSPLLRAMQGLQPPHQAQQQPYSASSAKDMNMKPWTLESNVMPNEMPNEDEYDGHKVNSFFDFTGNNAKKSELTFDKNDMIPNAFKGGNFYQQPANNEITFKFEDNYGYQSGYSNGFQLQFETNKPQFGGNNHTTDFHLEPTGFLNFDHSYQPSNNNHYENNNNYENDQMKLEYPY